MLMEEQKSWYSFEFVTNSFYVHCSDDKWFIYMYIATNGLIERAEADDSNQVKRILKKSLAGDIMVIINKYGLQFGPIKKYYL